MRSSSHAAEAADPPSSPAEGDPPLYWWKFVPPIVGVTDKISVL